MEVDQSWRVVLRNYFYLVYERYGITPPEEAEWSLPQLPATVPWLIAVEVPTMLMELGEVNKKTRIPAMVKQCEDISEHILESNCVAMYSTMVNVLLDNSPSLGKMQVFCAFSVSFCIYLRKHNMSDRAAKEIYKIANELFEVRFKSWMITNQGWVSYTIQLGWVYYYHVIF